MLVGVDVIGGWMSDVLFSDCVEVFNDWADMFRDCVDRLKDCCWAARLLDERSLSRLLGFLATLFFGGGAFEAHPWQYHFPRGTF